MLYNADAADQQEGLSRKRCRNPRCRAKLAAPAFDRLSAFCCAACCDAFFKTRCVVCEASITRKTHGQRLCRRAKCRSEFRRHRERFSTARAGTSKNAPAADISEKTSAKSAAKTAITRDRVWRVVAGPDLSEANLITPLDPEFAARLDRQRAEFTKRAKHEAAPPVLIGPHDPPVNIVGGYRFPGAPAIDLSPVSATASYPAPALEDRTDLEIPVFLRRAQESST
jgi:hypothetical protein